jgi:NADPH-dependent 2,4-dienoyl-CoA reductase/sulfur reductase-like enzyme
VTPEHCTVLIVGGGPAGLAAALALTRLGVRGITLLEREEETGGVPRFCHHTGFGWRDLHRITAGPDYARRYRQQVADAGVNVQTSAQATGWAGPRTLTVTSPTGVRPIQADAILLATGCRERPAAARLVPGNRPLGIFTTGSLQRLLHTPGQRIGRRAVVVGAELVSLSAVLTLAQAGIEVAAMLTDQPDHQIPFPFTPMLWYATRRWGVELIPQAQISRISGQRRVAAVEYSRLSSGQPDQLACDTVIFTGNWIPEHELVRTGGLALDPATRGPRSDGALRTSLPGIFAAGNLLRGAQSADQAALEGRWAAQGIAQFLKTQRWPQWGLPILSAAPVAWVTPNWVACPPEPAHFQYHFQVSQFCANARVCLYQGDRLLQRQHFRHLIPNCSYRLHSGWLRTLDVAGEAPCLRID